MTKLPEHITDALQKKATSLGNNPSLPESDSVVEQMLSKYYNSLCENVEEKPVNEIMSDLRKCVVECQKEEAKSKNALEQLCGTLVSNMFEIPEDTIKIDIHLTTSIDTTGYRMMPEEDEEFTFDDIADMKNIGLEISKRRMLNALVEGASESIAYNIENYVQELFKINPALPALYLKIIKYSQYLMYAVDETELQSYDANEGTVKVIMKAAPDMLEVNVEATLFPVLLQNTIKGILEVSVLQGLPDDKDKAYYIMKKSDYKLSEVWDSRFGVPLWERLSNMMPDLDSVGLNFFFMELSMLPTDLFNETLQEIFSGTKRGTELLHIICEKIRNIKDEEDFTEYIRKNNDRYPIEDGYFSEEELVSERPVWY